MAGLDMAQLTLRDLCGIQSETPEEFSLSQCGGTYVVSWGFPGGLVGLIPGSGRSLGEGNGRSTPVFLPGESHGQRRLVH